MRYMPYTLVLCDATPSSFLFFFFFFSLTIDFLKIDYMPVIVQFKSDWLHWWKIRILLSSRLHPSIILIVTAQYSANLVQ